MLVHANAVVVLRIIVLPSLGALAACVFIPRCVQATLRYSERACSRLARLPLFAHSYVFAGAQAGLTFSQSLGRSSRAGHHRSPLLQRQAVGATVLPMLSRVVHPNYSLKRTAANRYGVNSNLMIVAAAA